MGFWSFKDAADVLDIAESSVRRWVVSLENAGYKFERNEKRRKLTDEDMLALLRLKLLSQKMTLEEACIQVMVIEPSKGMIVSEEKEYDLIFKRFEEELFRLDVSIFWQGNKDSIGKIKNLWVQLKERRN